MAEDSISVELTTFIEFEETAMFAYLAQRIALLRNESPERSLVVSTLFAAAIVMGCRSVVSFISHDPAELDGFIFLAGLYWIYSLVGYLATRSTPTRKSCATSRRAANPISAARRTAARGSASLSTRLARS